MAQFFSLVRRRVILEWHHVSEKNITNNLISKEVLITLKLTMQTASSFRATSLLLQTGSSCILAFLYHLFNLKQKKINCDMIASLSKNGRLINLNKHEAEMMDTKGINVSMTFKPISKDQIRPTLWLRQRVRTVLEANPWLAGRLCKTGSGKSSPVVLWVPEIGGSEENLNRCFTHIEVESIAQLSTNPPDSAFTALGQECVNTEEPLWKVTLITHKTLDTCVLFVSMCHTLGDAFTFFNVAHMLSDCGPGLHSMNPDRVKIITDDVPGSSLFPIWLPFTSSTDSKRTRLMKAAMIPTRTVDLCFKCFKTIFCLPTIMSNKQLTDDIEVMDPSWIEEEKERAANLGVAVSSNDIIMSSILRTHPPRIGAMPINLRNHLPHIHDNLAGNYVGVIVLKAGDYATPIGVRNALQKALRTIKLKDQPREIVYGDIGLTSITNWASFFRDMSLPKFHCIHQEAVISPSPANGRLDILRGVWNGYIDSFTVFRNKQHSLAVRRTMVPL